MIYHIPHETLMNYLFYSFGAGWIVGVITLKVGAWWKARGSAK